MSGIEGFDRNRTLLFSISYRMLGSVMEAEDVVQEASEKLGNVPLLEQEAGCKR